MKAVKLFAIHEAYIFLLHFHVQHGSPTKTMRDIASVLFVFFTSLEVATEVLKKCRRAETIIALESCHRNQERVLMHVFVSRMSYGRLSHTRGMCMV